MRVYRRVTLIALRGVIARVLMTQEEAHHPDRVATHDSYTPPPGLPVPVDDGACQHLPGTTVPALSFPSTRGGIVDLHDR